MIKIILIGALLGLVLSLFFSFGPGFWGLIQNSIHYGFRKGAAFEVGVNFSDLMMVMLMLTILNTHSVTTILRTPAATIIGGSVIIIFGIVTFLRRPATTVEHQGRIRVVLKKVPDGKELALHGFALNTCNPSVWLYWVAVTSVIKAEVHLNDAETFAFFISMLLAELCGGILKCRLAAMLQNSISERLLVKVNHVLGTILAGLGIYLIIAMVVRLNHPERPEKEPAEAVTHFIQQQLRTSDSTQQGTDPFYFK